MNYYFHESMVAKMVSSNEYQEGYSVGFASGYNQGKADRDKEIAEHNVFFSNKPIEDIELDARADERAKVFDKIMSFINTSNKGNCDYYIIDQIENYINSHR